MTRPALAFDDLPRDAAARRELLEERARPDGNKPHLAPDREARLAETEERSAQCYIKNEDIVYRMRQVAQKIANTVPRFIRHPTPDTDPG